ncbi:MAG: hypothetical protein D6762_05080 [Candidatus Neomarinimicrobiota bacterium]|nr:MAG: hypothetical protein D6762_05080 [Candidatus Neomarinimicrobiota bacterium]
MERTPYTYWENGLYPRRSPTAYPGEIQEHLRANAITVEDSVENKISFNVMPGRPVQETLKMRRYYVWDDAIEAEFDREYFSSMKKSPDHLIFVTVLVHLQKMLYVYMCHYCGIPYDPYAPEKLKVWPTQLDIVMPRLITKHEDIHHLLKIKSVIESRPGHFVVTADSIVENQVTINGQAMVILIG